MELMRHPGMFAHEWDDYDQPLACEHCKVDYLDAQDEVRLGECPVRLRVSLDALCKSPKDRGWDVVYRAEGIVITAERGLPLDQMGTVVALGAANGFDLIDARLSGHFPEACMVLNNKESGQKWRARLGLET